MKFRNDSYANEVNCNNSKQLHIFLPASSISSRFLYRVLYQTWNYQRNSDYINEVNYSNDTDYFPLCILSHTFKQ